MDCTDNILCHSLRARQIHQACDDQGLGIRRSSRQKERGPPNSVNGLPSSAVLGSPNLVARAAPGGVGLFK